MRRCCFVFGCFEGVKGMLGEPSNTNLVQQGRVVSSKSPRSSTNCAWVEKGSRPFMSWLCRYQTTDSQKGPKRKGLRLSSMQRRATSSCSSSGTTNMLRRGGRLGLGPKFFSPPTPFSFSLFGGDDTLIDLSSPFLFSSTRRLIAPRPHFF